MEPRLLRHGNVEVIVQGLPAPQELQWSHVFSDMEIPSGCGGTIVEGEDGLQWSHVFSDMEISMGYLEAIFTELIDASMEPRLLRHGNHMWQGRSTLVPSRLQWSHVFSDMEIRKWLATCLTFIKIVLQWSHVFSDMEMVWPDAQRE